ncbi:pyrroline-5-carboxylate reductase [Clostridium sp. CX1]|uniref:pyrroline-5-carboxylate reductase n=1 Tax=Clostridium sp. CX1 TaxID=2978346 RepID=UPI0021BEF7C0|nr:pyrroline-5-carboxylate reductase [Clostridium sp. CX1]MCT8976339.1 pyrroline-5-carboxylate reductase [Clostridium sp. CX1]
MDKKVGFLGCGNMAQAIIGGIIRSKLVNCDNVAASGVREEQLRKIKEKYGIRATDDNKELAQFSDILFLAVKPEKYEIVAEEIKEAIKDEIIIVTMAPGISTKDMEVFFDKKIKVVRTMPNTPALVGEGMTAVCHNDEICKEELEQVIKILESFGKVQIIDEKLMDVIPAVSGSSPAYVYMFIEALAEGGVLRGLTWDQAYKLAAQAVLGSAKMVLETGEHPAVLRDKVCSPGGTTIASVYSLEKNNFKGTIIEAMEKCTEKIIDMSKNK